MGTTERHTHNSIFRRYLDRRQDQFTSQKHTRAVIRCVSELGFLIKPSKSSLVPAQRLEHPDFIINTTKMTKMQSAKNLQGSRIRTPAYGIQVVDHDCKVIALELKADGLHTTVTELEFTLPSTIPSVTEFVLNSTLFGIPSLEYTIRLQNCMPLP